jgi:hypothetical protein
MNGQINLNHVVQKSLRPLWISQRTPVWLNEVVPEVESWDFNPIILSSASAYEAVDAQGCVQNSAGTTFPEQEMMKRVGCVV